MAVSIERLLRLTADYHSFCGEDAAKENNLPGSDEMSMEELDSVAAAGAQINRPEEAPDNHAIPRRN